MTAHKRIEITKREDLRVGDIATFSYKGREFTGPLWEVENGALYIGAAALRLANGHWTTMFDFVRATRPAPALPTEPGATILVSECRGERLNPPILAVRDCDGEWLTLAREIGGSRWVGHLPEHITEWAPAKAIPA